MIGYAKFSNRNYGNVYYRGVSQLFDNTLPAVMRDVKSGQGVGINNQIKRVMESDFMHHSLKLESTKIPYTRQDHIDNALTIRYNKYRIEALVQHYSGKTRFLDVVDNHWVALWMGLHNFIPHGNHKLYLRCEPRTIKPSDLYVKSNYESAPFANMYAYILLLAMPFSRQTPHCGVKETNSFVEVDLRTALPSIYVRPHAQHALAVRRRDAPHTTNASYYDLSSQVVGILRTRTDRAIQWIGKGEFLTVHYLFPSPSIDTEYDTLLLHPEIFLTPFEIRKYY